MKTDSKLERYGQLRRVADDCIGLSASAKRCRVGDAAGDLSGVTSPPEEWPQVIGGDSGFLNELDRYSLAYLWDLLGKRTTGSIGRCTDTDFVGYCPEIVGIRSRIVDFVRARSPIFLIGERGTGKGQLVRAVGARIEKIPLTLALASLPEDLADAELFGHKKGTFTGADAERTGVIMTAQRSRRLLFLDDVAECSPAVQAKLLTVLDDGVMRPVGSDDVVMLGRGADRSFRLVSSSQPGSLGKLRPDLLDRLSTVQVWIPPLRNRGLDILLLADYFAQSHAGEGMGNCRLKHGARRLLLDYDWPGNVRQLSNVVSRAAIQAGAQGSISERTMTLALAEEKRLAKARDASATSVNGSADHADLSALGQGPFPTMSEMRDRHFRRALDRADGNLRRAAALLDVSRSTVHRWQSNVVNGR